MLVASELERLLQAELPGAEQVWVNDLTGNGDHFQVRVVSEAFAGLPMAARHEQVFGALKALLQTARVHALALETFTPEQWARFGA